MARLAKDLVEKRTAFVISFAKKNKGANGGKGPTAAAINDAVSKAFKGVKMRLAEVYRLKKMAMGNDSASKAQPEAKATTAGRSPGRLPPKSIAISPTTAGRKPGRPARDSGVHGIVIPYDSERGQAIVREALEQFGLKLA